MINNENEKNNFCKTAPLNNKRAMNKISDSLNQLNSYKKNIEFNSLTNEIKMEKEMPYLRNMKTNISNKGRFPSTESSNLGFFPTAINKPFRYSSQIAKLSKPIKTKTKNLLNNNNKPTPFQILEKISNLTTNTLQYKQQLSISNNNSNFSKKNINENIKDSIHNNFFLGSKNKISINLRRKNNLYCNLDKSTRIKLKGVGNYCALMFCKRDLDKVDNFRKINGIYNCEVDEFNPNNRNKYIRYNYTNLNDSYNRILSTNENNFISFNKSINNNICGVNLNKDYILHNCYSQYDIFSKTKNQGQYMTMEEL